MNLMENKFNLPTPDGFQIHGVLNGLTESDKLAIFVHGLTGEKENHLYYNSARYFPERGIHTVRFDLFSNEEKGRTLTDCSMTTFVNDLNQVIDFYSRRYTEIHLIGHSIGGCIVINANQSSIKSLILWDTALQSDTRQNTPFQYDSPFQYDAHSEKYIARLKIEYFLSKELIRERAEQDERIIKKIVRPVKLIFAGTTTVKNTWTSRFCLIQPCFEQVVIHNAGHGFNEFGVNESLFLETLKWITHDHG